MLITSYFQIIDGILFKGVRQPKRVIIQNEERQNIIVHYHLNPDISSQKHRSASITAREISQQFYWKTILRDTKEFVANCEHCSRNPPTSSAILADENGKRKGLLLTKNNKVWSKIYFCIHGPYPTANGELKHILTLHDECSKWIVGKIIPTMSGKREFCQ